MRRSTLIGARLIEGPDREFATPQDPTLIAIHHYQALSTIGEDGRNLIPA
jgi:hypothetical protein